MKAIPFSKANLKIKSNQPGTTGMHIFTDGHTCVSEWALTDEDIMLILNTKKIQLIVRAQPEKHPDVALYAGDVIPDNLIG